MPGIRALSKVQLGAESTPGTNVATTTVWRGTGFIKDDLEVTFPEETIGVLGGTTRSYIGKYAGSIELTGDLTFEQFGYIGNAGIKFATPTTDASSAFIRTYSFPILAASAVASTDLVTLSIEGGDNQQAEEFSYGYVSEFTIEGNAGEAATISATVNGQQVSPTTFTASPTVTDVESVLVSKGKLYADATTDTVGTTQLSQTLLGFSLSVNTGWMPVYAADGSLNFSFIKQTMPEITLEVTFEHNASAVAEKLNWRNQTARQLRLRFDGSALTTTDAGAAYDTKVFIVDLVGKWESWDVLDEQDGNNVVKGTFRARYDSNVAAYYARIINANQLATMP